MTNSTLQWVADLMSYAGVAPNDRSIGLGDHNYIGLSRILAVAYAAGVKFTDQHDCENIYGAYRNQSPPYSNARFAALMIITNYGQADVALFMDLTPAASVNDLAQSILSFTHLEPSTKGDGAKTIIGDLAQSAGISVPAEFRFCGTAEDMAFCLAVMGGMKLADFINANMVPVGDVPIEQLGLDLAQLPGMSEQIERERANLKLQTKDAFNFAQVAAQAARGAVGQAMQLSDAEFTRANSAYEAAVEAAAEKWRELLVIDPDANIISGIRMYGTPGVGELLCRRNARLQRKRMLGL